MRGAGLVCTLLVGSALFVAGCGGDGGEEQVTITKAQLIKRADRICGQTEDRQQALVGKFAERRATRDRAGEEELIRFAGLPPLRAEAKELRELSDQADVPQFDAYLESFEAAIEASQAEPQLLLVPGKSPFDQTERLAAQLGLKVCGGT